MRYFLGLALFVFVFAGIFAQPTRSITDELTAKLTPTPVRKKSTTSANSVKKPAAKKVPTAQTQIQTTAKTKTKTTPPKTSNEKEEFDKAWAIETPVEKIVALKKFLEKYPTSSRKNAVLELIAVTRIQLGRERLKTAETADGVALLKAAVAEIPVPVADELFNSTLVKIPSELYFNGQRSEAIEIAGSLEDKIGGSPKQLLALAAFYLSIEGGSDAKRLAEKAVALDPTLPAGYQTLGLAARLNFDLDDAEKAYSKALELEPDSLQSLRSLAELKRAQGKPDEAVGLYRRILEKDAGNLPAETGLILSLFDAGKRADAEVELSKSADQNRNNVILLAGTAYWYAGHGEPDKAIEYANSAIEKDPRYIWSHLALAAGLSAKKQPAAAEEVLLKARQFGNFPTLEYELAAVRLRSGFFRDAADELKKSFEIKNGTIRVKLGGRVEREGPDFVELLAEERRASIFEPEAADDPETAARLKSLLELDSAVNAPEPREEIVVKAADDFVSGSDNMRVHRALFAASSLLGKRIALPKVLEYTNSAIDGADNALDVADPGAAVMASELYDSRAIAFARQQLIKVPDVPRSALSAILRGRIEEIAGWALYYQNSPAEATVRLRRAVSVMPPKSAWWRSSMWKLGAALQADGKDSEALDSYIKSYSIDKPDLARYVTVEVLYRKVHGNTEGLEAKIGPNPQPVAPPPTETAQKDPDPSPASSPTPDTAIKPDDSIATKTDPTPEPSPSQVIEPTPTPAVIVEVTPTRSPEITPKAIAEAKATPAAQPTPTPVAEIVATPTPPINAAPTPIVETPPTPTPETSPSPLIQPTATPTAVVNPTPSPEASSSRTPETAADVSTTPTPSPTSAEASSPKGQQVNKPDDSVVAASDSKTKPLFEPVIITVPRPKVKKDPADNVVKSENPLTDEATRNEGNPSPDGEKRARIVAGKEVSAVVTPTCTISVSQETLSILNNGGSLGVLVQMEGEDSLKALTASSDSPADVEIRLEPEIAGVKGQAFYVIRSATTKTGDFKVRFVAPCGSKEISVNVR
ncbi:MAG: hypothetical protein ABI878_05295 [Acidobacteriota bacterium]